MKTSVLIMAALLAFGVTALANRPSGACEAPADKRPEAKNYDRPGFVTIMDKHGRLWVLRENSKELAEFREKGEPAKQVVRPRIGPDGLTLKSVDSETIDAYLKAEAR